MPRVSLKARLDHYEVPYGEQAQTSQSCGVQNLKDISVIHALVIRKALAVGRKVRMLLLLLLLLAVVLVRIDIVD